MQADPIETLKKVKKLNKCTYPRCKNDSFMQVMLPVGELTESGQIQFLQEGKETSVQSSCSLCDYHFVFANKGIVNLVNQEGMVRLVAPTDLIELIETVVGAIEINRRKNALKGNKTKKL